jgi:hypothetical protein
MTAGKRTEITIETDQVLIIRRRCSTQVWCQECGREADMVALAEAGVLTGMSAQALRDCSQARGWHIAQGPDGVGLICLQSLLKSK